MPCLGRREGMEQLKDPDDKPYQTWQDILLHV